MDQGGHYGGSRGHYGGSRGPLRWIKGDTTVDQGGHYGGSRGATMVGSRGPTNTRQKVCMWGGGGAAPPSPTPLKKCV